MSGVETDTAAAVKASADLLRCLRLARIGLAFGRVNRATLHEDGLRPETDTDPTVMLGLIACELAPLHLIRPRVAAVALTDRAGFLAAHARQYEQLRAEYPEFPEAHALLRASMVHAEACWLLSPVAANGGGA